MTSPPYNFAAELAHRGPDAPTSSPPTLADAQAYTRWLAETHYENFPVVSALLPGKLRQHFRNVYAFCRWADDLGDEVDDPAQSIALLQWWRRELSDCFDARQECRHPVFIALRETITQFQLPAQPFHDLISAFETDQTVKHYDTNEQLLDYCLLSANPVGRIVLILCGADSPRNRELSDSVCTGFQLANMWQDVARDADIGRTYLPAADCTRFGYSATELQQRITNEAFLSLMQHEVTFARTLLEQGLPLADLMPGRLRVDIELFAQGGLAILRKIEAINYRVWETRPALTRWDFAKLMGRVVCRRATSWTRSHSTATPESPAINEPASDEPASAIVETTRLTQSLATEERECPSA